MKMSRNINFARNLVRAKIAETVFVQMLRDTGEFTVLPFGAEKVNPGITWQEYDRSSDAYDAIRSAPDFAVINQKTKYVHLIEVKWRKKVTPSVAKRIALRMSKSWNPSYLLLASVDGFYFDEVSTILENNGKIRILTHPQIPDSVQKKYLAVLNDFENT